MENHHVYPFLIGKSTINMVVTLERTRSGYQDKGVLWTPTAGANLSQAVNSANSKACYDCVMVPFPTPVPADFSSTCSQVVHPIELIAEKKTRKPRNIKKLGPNDAIFLYFFLNHGKS